MRLVVSADRGGMGLTHAEAHVDEAEQESQESLQHVGHLFVPTGVSAAMRRTHPSSSFCFLASLSSSTSF
jgi:hypothetical protein